VGFTYLPAMHFLFGSAAIDAHSWLQIVLVASVILWLVELEKWLRRKQQA
jgi:hypothetical protein